MVQSSPLTNYIWGGLKGLNNMDKVCQQHGHEDVDGDIGLQVHKLGPQLAQDHGSTGKCKVHGTSHGEDLGGSPPEMDSTYLSALQAFRRLYSMKFFHSQLWTLKHSYVLPAPWNEDGNKGGQASSSTLQA